MLRHMRGKDKRRARVDFSSRDARAALDAARDDGAEDLQAKEDKDARRERYLMRKRERERQWRERVQQQRERAACTLQRNARIMRSNRLHVKWEAWLKMAYDRFNAEQI